MQRNTVLLKNLSKEKITFHKTLLLVILAITILLLAACHSDSDHPEQIVTDFYKAVERRDADAVIRFIYIDKEKGMNENQLRIKIPQLFNAYGSQMRNHNGLKDIKKDNVEYSNDKKKAKVYYIMEYNDGEKQTFSADIINKDGKWLFIAFD